MTEAVKELPDSWVLSDLGELSEYVQRGKSPKYTEKSDLPVINQKCVRWWGVDVEHLKYIHDDQAPKWDEIRFLRPGDVLWNSTGTGTIGRACVYRGELERVVVDSHVTIVRADPKALEPRYAFYYIMSPLVQADIEEMQSGSTNQVELSKKAIVEKQIPLAPLPEQQRIVEKIETLFARLDKGEEAVQEVQKLLTRYRQSVLKSAVTGQLTADWRAERKGELEDGEELLTRILERRRDTWGGRGKYKPAMEPEADTLPGLPSNWAWGTLDQLVAGRARSMQSGPFGSSLKHSEFTDHGILVVGIDNVRDGSFSMGSENRISPDKYKELKKYTARSGDLLVTVMASLGRTCVIPDDLETAIITKHVYRISMEQDLVAPEFYNVLLQTEWVSRRRMFENAQGQTRPGLNSSILRALPVPVFSREEQLEILKRLDVELTAISQLEAKVETELKRSASLRQSILKDAFAGRLVPQDPNDEPASALLARIAEAKTQTKKTRRKVQA